MTQLADLSAELTAAQHNQSVLQSQLDSLKQLLIDKKLQHKQLKVILATGGITKQLNNELDEIKYAVDTTCATKSSIQFKLTNESNTINELNHQLQQIDEKKKHFLSSNNSNELEQQLQHNITLLDQQHELSIQSQQLQHTQLHEQYNIVHNSRLQLQQQLNESIQQKNKLQSVLDYKLQHISELTHLTSNSTSIMNELQQSIDSKQSHINELLHTIQSCEKQCIELNSQIELIDIRYKEEQKRRKEFQFKYEDIKGKIRVYARIRPLNHNEIINNESTILRCGMNVWSIELNETTRDVMGNISDKYREYVFDHIFQPGLIQADGTYSTSNASQAEVFEECKDFAELTLNGINTCIFAYGQSGTGKTYTMAGIKPSPSNPNDTSLLGLKPRMIEYIWNLVQQNQHTHTYNISCYLVEIYMNKLEDVFWKHQQNISNDTTVKSPKKSAGAVEPPELKIRVDNKKRVEIENVLMKQFNDYNTMNTYVEQAENLRRTRRTGLNEASSRSHLVFTILITGTEINTGKTTRGKLSLVDLAGSERADKTNVDGLSKQQRDAMIDEGIAINESLRMLKNVFRILGSINIPGKEPSSPKSPKAKSNDEVVQYRGNILTELMQDSLGGNAKTLMFVNVGPAASNISETQDSLQYGDYVKNITNEKVEAAVDYTEQIRVLNDKLMKYKQQYGD